MEMTMTAPCPTCHGLGTITEPSPFTYRFGDWITRPCDCAKARDPPQPDNGHFGWRAYADFRLQQIYGGKT